MSMAFYAQADVKIGVAGPFTGPNATYGAPVLEGGLAGGGRYQCRRRHQGEKIVLVQGDDACEPKQAVAVANRLVD
ncbi:Branched-chain amino acid ABC transporter, amino acid-binding protein (TC 3.A.1.4.1) [Klebsiella aerogenes]|nr:Branched-chain amino acid ABC transporter, amino acid-binding protein (TC 3.A.1.4.1) [Klebsiella aerogenes]